MIAIRNETEIEKLRAVSKLAARAMEKARDSVRPGVTTRDISDAVQRFIESNGARPAFLGSRSDLCLGQ
jgi:methionyl aminopeptidase